MPIFPLAAAFMATLEMSFAITMSRSAQGLCLWRKYAR
jgi:hypothetical protein